MKVVILGGDGFCGWPTVLGLSQAGHEVVIVDNFTRRRIDAELGTGSLTPIASLAERCAAWASLTGREIAHHDIDVAFDYAALRDLLAAERPGAIVHLAELRSAPYSMKSPTHKLLTVKANLGATHNLLAALVETGQRPHVVHLGSIGVYGYGATRALVPEGYLTVSHGDGAGGAVERDILHPTSPESIYHLTKAQDQLLIDFYNRNDGLPATILHQGIVWGSQTPLTEGDARLVNRLDYDGDYGTVVNRFLVQAALGRPLTVYGSGGQTRAFIHIRDTVRCIELVLATPPEPGARVRIINQATETHSVAAIADKVARLTGAGVERVPNPRAEAASNPFPIVNATVLRLGLEPTLMDEPSLAAALALVRRHIGLCDASRLAPSSRWR